MLKHGRAGVPMEVMGLMLGEFVDDYTVRVIDVFAMPQSGTVSFPSSYLTASAMLCEGSFRIFFKCPTSPNCVLNGFFLSNRVSASKLWTQYSRQKCWIC